MADDILTELQKHTQTLASIERKLPDGGLPLGPSSAGPEVEALHDALARIGYRVPDAERQEKVVGTGTADALRRVQAAHGLQLTGELDPATQAVLSRALAESSLARPRIEGRVLLDNGKPASRLTISIHRRELFGRVERIGETATDENGYYSLAYEAGTKAANLEIRTVDADGKEVSLSRTKLGAERHGVLNVVAPTGVVRLAAEYDRMMAEVADHLGEGGRLSAAQETEEQPDLSILQQATGWDARLLALSATAETLSTSTGISAKALYALHRHGLPTDAGLLSLVPAKTVADTLLKASKAGIASLDGAEIKGAMAAFTSFAETTRRTLRSPGAPSTFGELIDAAGLPDEKKRAFERLYFEHANDGEELFKRARDEAKLSDAEVERLKLRGKLAHLTVNNVRLIDSLAASLGGDLRRLVAKDLHTPPAWEKTLKDLAGGDPDQLAKLVPSAYTGEKVEERLAAYAADMARKVRLSFPTHVISRMVEKGEVSLGERFASRKDAVKAFLDKAADLQLTLGQKSLSAFVRENRALLFPAGVSEQDLAETVAAVALVQRLYQITPTDEAMAAVAKAGIASAQDVVAMSREAFVARFEKAFGSKDTAELVYRKAQQVAAVTMEVAASAKLLAGMPEVYALTGSLDSMEATVGQHFPTLEKLFHSVDFCACQHCRSVLSPAAYLTDMLRFLEKPVGSPPKSPFDVFKARRPDILNLPLTCENTNTALPYIDVVNEILEYQVAIGALDARDTGEDRSEDLIAEPQYVEKAVYEAGNQLQQATYPLSLPFHLPLETVRRLLGRWHVSLAELLSSFRPTDELSETGKSYGWAAIFTEQLGLTPPEIALYTNPNPLDSWYKLYGYSTEDSAKVLASAKTLARKLGVSYVELAALVQTWFVNPVASVVPAVPGKILVLKSDKDDACDFGKTTLEYGDGKPADATAYLRLNLLVRLWKKLGWTLDETDQALRTLLPGGAATLADKDKLGAALGTAILYLSHLETLHHLLPGGKDGRIKLLPLWGPIPNSGSNSLYASLFLTPAARRADPLLDLSSSAARLENHLPAVQAALGLDTADVARILAENGQSFATAKLTLDVLSLLYRYAFFAKALRISVSELISLVHVSGLDPFTVPGVNPVDELADDVLYTQTIGFVRAARALANRGLQQGELEYLLFHRSDAVGDFRSAAAVPFGLLRDLAAEIRRIRAEHPADDDSAGTITDEALRTELSLVLPGDVVATFFPLWTGTARYTAIEAASDSSQLDPTKAPLKDAPYLQVSYDPGAGQQALVCAGVLTDTTRDGLLAALAEPQKTLLSKLLGQIQKQQEQVRPFFDDWLVAPVGFFSAAEASSAFATLFDRPFGAETEDKAQQRERDRRSALVRALVPFVVQRLIRKAVLDGLTADLGLDASIATSILTRTEGPLVDPSVSGRSLLDAFAAAAEQGATATIYPNPDLTGTATVVTAPSLDTQYAPGTPRSAMFAGYLEVPVTGQYAFSVNLQKQAASATLFLGDGPDPVLRGTAGKPNDEIRGSVPLTAGVLVPFRLVVTSLDGGHASVTVQGEGLRKQPISALSLVPEQTATRVQRARILARKAARVVQMFALGEHEVRYLLDALGASTTTFPTRPTDASDAAARATARTIFRLLLRIAAYTDLREVLGGTEEVVDVFEAARRSYLLGATPNTAEILGAVYRRVANLLRSDVATVEAAAKQLGYDTVSVTPTATDQRAVAAGFADEAKLRRLVEVVVLVGQLRVTVPVAAGWATVAPTMDTADKVRGALKGQYDDDTWRRVAQPVFDELRQKKRDALVAYVLAAHPAGFQSADQLFEYFLVDPGVEPVVLTSRIRLAISSVQTFVQRCFMNLEPNVAPSALDAEVWAWMKRYRVWEANRKIFLYPENFLEPELRDDQTHLYRELVGALLKGDVTNDLAEDAFFKYLSGLDTIAKLEIVTSYRQTGSGDPPLETLHVIGRTYSLPHKYFYRRRTGKMWSPWEPVDLDIEGDQVIAVVWRGRFHLFWLTYLEKADKAAVASSTVEGVRTMKVSDAAPKQMEVQVSFAEYFQGAWTSRTSSGFGNEVYLAKYQDPREAFIWVRKREEPGGDGAVLVHLNEPHAQVFRILSRNAAPELRHVGYQPRDDWNGTYSPLFPRRIDYYSYDPGLHLRYSKRETKFPGAGYYPTEVFDEPVLKKGDIYSLAPSGNPKGYVLFSESPYPSFKPVGPFFYQNGRDTFHVSVKVDEIRTQGFNGFALSPPTPGLTTDASKLTKLVITPFQPARIKPGDPPWNGDSNARFMLGETTDWLIRPGLGVRFGAGVVGARGHVDPMTESIESVVDPSGDVRNTGRGPGARDVAPGRRDDR
jgi:Neuraminidase-like domain/Salmonella virulence plasmid 28.1kDa A protein/Putative peptidoglycan binding domain